VIGRGANESPEVPGKPLWLRSLRAQRLARKHRVMTMKQATLTKADLIEEVLRITELPRKESEIIVETVFDSIIESLQKGEKIEIRGFGSFRTRQRRGRVGRNPKTGEKVEVPAKRIPFFKPSKELKDFVNTQASGATTETASAENAAS
jgi:integration host factor subunit beta